MYIDINYTVKKVALTFGQLKKQPTVNNHPIGENSPNLVTLLFVHFRGLFVLLDDFNKDKEWINNRLSDRVTRLGGFLPIGRLLTFGWFLKNI
jgi:hypothetical protein